MTSDALLRHALYLVTAVAVFVYLLNRYLFALRDGPANAAACLATLGALVAAAVRLTALPGTLPIPLFLIGALTVGEVRSLHRRRRWRAAPPIERSGPPPSLLRPFTTATLTVSRYEIPTPHRTAAPLRLVLLTDLHLNRLVPPTLFDEAFAVARDAAPDVVLLGGDYLHPTDMRDRLVDLLTSVRGRLGTFAVLGNHDRWFDRDLVEAALAAASADLLRNDWRVLDGLAVGGCDVPFTGDAWPAPPPDLPPLRVVLSHSPDAVFAASTADPLLVLAGHTHGGQCRLPGLGSVVVPSRHGRLFDEGHFLVDGTHLVVSRGIGSQVPFRLWCPPEVVIVDLVPV